MKDIAEYTGVSTATVSRVLNDNYPVNIETKKKVLKAMKELNYKPNLVARNLRSKKSNLVAIVVADIQNPYYTGIAREIDQNLFQEGYNLITCNTDESLEKEQEIIRMLLSRNIDAVAISPSDSEKVDLSPLIEQNVPVVLVDRKVKGFNLPFVGIRNVEEAYSLTTYLIQKGHQNIGVISGKLNNSTGFERLQGFQQAMKDHGLTLRDDWVLNGKFDEEQTYQVLKRFIAETRESPTAWLICNNLMTKGALRAFKEARIKIPEDVSVVSFGALVNQDFFDPKLTCVKQDTTDLGRKVAELLLAQLKQQKQLKEVTILMDSEFVEGGSVKVME
jgi:LacI family transcriptional regulator